MTHTVAPAIHAVLFDFGLVLSGPPEPAAWSRMLAIAGLDEQSFSAGYWAPRHNYDRGALKGAAYWQAVAQHNGKSFTTEQVASLIAADIDLWTDMNVSMVAWAERLQHAGVRTGILSNIGDSMAEGICAKLPWLDRFDHCTWSHALGIAKPEPEIYVVTAEALGTPVEQILFLDDRADNIAAARAVGMQAIQYAGHAAFERSMREHGWGELLEMGATARQP